MLGRCNIIHSPSPGKEGEEREKDLIKSTADAQIM